MPQHPLAPAPISTVAESPRIVALVAKDNPAPIVIVLASAAQVVNAPARSEPPELTFDARLDRQGVSEVRAGARGGIAIIAVAFVLIALLIVIGLLATLHDSPRGSNSPREVPPREDLGRCIERTERPCACAGS